MDSDSRRDTPLATSERFGPGASGRPGTARSESGRADESAGSAAPTFLSSVLSAAQNAANSLTNFTAGPTAEQIKREQSFPLVSEPAARARSSTEPSRPAADGLEPSVASTVSTLGRGELSLQSLLSPDTAEADAADAKARSGSVTRTTSNGARSASVARGRRRTSSVSKPAVPAAPGLPAPSPAFPPPAEIPEEDGGQAPQRFTGYAVASHKRNRDFHQLFRSVPEDDFLIEDYGCALSREILLQGRLYISEQHICFNSNIFGWITNLVISFDEVVAIEKKTTVGLFPNAIVVQTLHARNVFASFISRDSTYELICSIWRTGSGIDYHTDDTMDSGDEAGENDDDDDDDDDEEEDGTVGDDTAESGAVEAPATGAAAAEPVLAPEDGPAKHAPTQCGCGQDHYDKVVCDATFSAPLGKVCNLLWSDNTTWIENYLNNVLRILELSKPTPFAPSEAANGNKSRTFNYIKPLYASMGPKQTKCFCTETIEHWDFDDYVSVLTSISTPDVPNGNLFVVKARYCMTWAENNTTRMFISCTVEWSGKSWIKGPIEKGANDGQVQASRELCEAIRKEIQPPPAKKAGRRKGKRKRDLKGKSLRADSGVGDDYKRPPQSWVAVVVARLVRAINGFTGAAQDSPTEANATSALAIIALAVVFVLVLERVLFIPFSSSRPHPTSVDAKWSTLWELEESDLWVWMEDRTDSDEPFLSPKDTATQTRPKDWLSRKEVEDGIAITQMRLDLMRSKLGNRK
ncbi:uncharacterized protein V1510DRAFT_373612 [Dipodascopsis tothii]|uniref:uncharacterized protein n=1 Tax=Dipodascopsis tothii TaxID=44089 RepID=UPI0034CDD1BA